MTGHDDARVALGLGGLGHLADRGKLLTAEAGWSLSTGTVPDVTGWALATAGKASNTAKVIKDVFMSPSSHYLIELYPPSLDQL